MGEADKFTVEKIKGAIFPKAGLFSFKKYLKQTLKAKSIPVVGGRLPFALSCVMITLGKPLQAEIREREILNWSEKLEVTIPTLLEHAGQAKKHRKTITSKNP